jgi:hypothetical protein
VTRLQALQPGFNSQQRLGFFFILVTVSRLALELTKPLIQWVPGCEADHSSSSFARLRMHGAIPPFPICLHGMVLSYVKLGMDVVNG